MFDKQVADIVASNHKLFISYPQKTNLQKKLKGGKSIH